MIMYTVGYEDALDNERFETHKDALVHQDKMTAISMEDATADAIIEYDRCDKAEAIENILILGVDIVPNIYKIHIEKL